MILTSALVITTMDRADSNQKTDMYILELSHLTHPRGLGSTYDWALRFCSFFGLLSSLPVAVSFLRFRFASASFSITRAEASCSSSSKSALSAHHRPAWSASTPVRATLHTRLFDASSRVDIRRERGKGEFNLCEGRVVNSAERSGVLLARVQNIALKE